MTDRRWSRRDFLFSSMAGAAGAFSLLHPPPGWASKHTKGAVVAGPHPLARQDWPPAIVPDHAGIDRGYCCFTDEFGRLAVVDLRRPADAKHPPHVIAELNGLGKKVFDFKVVGDRGYGVVLKGNESNDAQLTLICVSLQPIAEPALIASIPLDKFSEATRLTASGNIICVSGTSFNSENTVAIYQVQAKGRQLEPTLLATWNATAPVVDMDLQDRKLCILQPSQIDYLDMISPTTPQVRSTLDLDGDFKSLARFKDIAIVSGITYGDATSGKPNGRCVAKLIALEPQMRLGSQLGLEPITNVLDSCAQKDRILILGEGATDRFLISLSYDKLRQLTNKQSVTLPKESSGGYGATSSVLLTNKTAYIASGWTGVQVMSSAKGTWVPTYRYTIPRLPASGIATWGDRVVLAGSDLKLYDIAQPDKPSLVSTLDVASSVRSIVGAGSFILCLGRDSMILRKMDSLSGSVATVSVVGQQVCYDKAQQKAYVLQKTPDLKNQPKKTILSKFKLYSDEIALDQNFDLPGVFSRGSANAGSIAVAGLNDLTLFTLNEKADQISTRHFENLAIRDISLQDAFIVVTAVDQKSSGFLLVLSKDQKDMRVLGSTDLPHDGTALSATTDRAVTVGKSPDGKDVFSIVDISNPSAPRVVSTMGTVEAASAVVIKDKYAIVAGRGLEIFSLT